MLKTPIFDNDLGNERMQKQAPAGDYIYQPVTKFVKTPTFNRHPVLVALMLILTVRVGFTPSYWTEAELNAAEYCDGDAQCEYSYVKEWNQIDLENEKEKRKASEGVSIHH